MSSGQTGEVQGSTDRGRASDEIRVLTVDDDGDFADLTATFLERADDRLSVSAVTSAAAAREHLESADVDCVVSDHDMPGTNGLDLLADVRESHPELPFILFTGKGSEDIASEAISAGVTEYMQKAGGSDQYAVLANRVVNAVEQRRSREAVERAQERFRLLVEEATDVILALDRDGVVEYASPSAETVIGRSPAALEGENAFDLVSPPDREAVLEEFDGLVEGPENRRAVEFRHERPDGELVWLEARGRNLLDNDVIEGLVVYLRDVTDRMERERELAETSQRLEAVVEASPLPIVALDPDGTVTLWNEAAESLFGWAAADVVGEPNPIVPPAKQDEFDELRERVLDGEAFTGVEITRETADGSEVDLVLSTAPIRERDDGVSGIMAVLAEASDRA